LFVPSVANQAINPNFRISPTLTLPQAAFNTSVFGAAISTIPPYALGFNPYPQAVSIGGGAALSYGGGYPGMMAYPMGGYGGGLYGGYGGYGSAMSGTYGGMSGSQMSASPYGASAQPYAAAQSGSYPAVSSTNDVANPRLVALESNSALVSSSKPDNPSTTRDVWVYDNYFSPATIMVPAGTTVRWINYGYHEHSVASGSGDWDSGPLRRGAEFSLTFSKPGTYAYTCRYHPRQMTAKVVVTK
jgi:plastocyanin